MDEASIYGFGRSFMPSGNAHQWRKGEFYRYYAAPKEFELPKPPPRKRDATKGRRRRSTLGTDKSIVPFRWSQRANLEARAMVLTGETLFVAGPLGNTHLSLDAFEGQEGVRLRAIATSDGEIRGELVLDARPVFDGLAAANGRLYLTAKDGTLTCFAGR
jgi:hypothetical protein